MVLIKEYSLLSTNTGPILENTTNHPIRYVHTYIRTYVPYRMVGCIFQYHIQGHFNCQKAFSILPISVVSHSVESTQSPLSFAHFCGQLLIESTQSLRWKYLGPLSLCEQVQNYVSCQGHFSSPFSIVGHGISQNPP